jgi:conjugative relaxase-like TrwC/TraI family protein
MLRFFQITSPNGATRYYNSALSHGDYHSQEGRTAGTWHGKAAARLGLSGEVTAKAFAALAHNRHPLTGEQLTPRNRSDRTVANDITVDAPKSVSLLWGLTGDERLRDAVIDSNRETMEDIEGDFLTRVRRGGKQEDRRTGNAAWATFTHETARPAEKDGLPDMQIHAHNVFFNLTQDDDPAERRFKAAQFRELRRDAPYYQAAFEARLADRLRQLGYAVERRGKSWEIAGIDRGLIEKFSRRTEHIERVAREKNITDPRAKEQLAAKTRRKKTHDLSDGELRRYWAGRLSGDEMRSLADVFDRAQVRGREAVPPLLTPEQAVAFSARHLFERQSVVPERKLLAEALRQGVGSVTVEGIKNAVQRAGLLWAERDGKRLFTAPEVLAEEQRMIAFARDSRGTRKPLGKASRPFTRDWLNAGQKAAVRHILDSCDAVTVIRGAAGVGKTTLLTEAKEAIEENGLRFFAFAPSADASRGTLRGEGFADADTVARLLVDENLQDRVRGQVVLVDEAGLLGTKTMAQLFGLVERLGARLIVAGDQKQHGAVERSGAGALRLLEQRAGLKVAHVTEIQRQKDVPLYKDAVTYLSDGDTKAGLDRLESLGWLRELAGDERERQLAADYLQAISERKKNGEHKTALVISPTHAGGERITSAVRETMKRQGKLVGPEREFLRLERIDLTEAQRSQAANYAAGDVVQAFQNVPGLRRGERVTVLESSLAGVRVRNGTGEVKALPLDQAGRFQVFRPATLKVAAGDRVRITNNGFTKDKAHRLDNGALYTVRSFSRGGDLVLDNGWVVAARYGHLTHGYVLTSHASQSKTVDQVFIGQGAESTAASSREQLYVSVSRGREKAVIYSDSLPLLRQAVEKSDERLTATELVGVEARRRRGRLLKHVDHMRRWASLARQASQMVLSAVRGRKEERGLEGGR